MGSRPLKGRATAGRDLVVFCNFCGLSALSRQTDSVWLRSRSSGPHALAFITKPDNCMLGLEMTRDAKLLERDIRVQDSLNFTTHEGPHLMSAITGGDVSLAELNQNVKLASTEFLVIDHLGTFELTLLEINKGIHVIGHGITGRLEIGPAGFLKDQRPTILQWIAAKQSWLLYLNAIILIATTAMAVLRKMKVVGGE